MGRDAWRWERFIIFGRSISLGCELLGFVVSPVYACESGQEVMVVANGWTPSDNCSLADWLVNTLRSWVTWLVRVHAWVTLVAPVLAASVSVMKAISNFVVSLLALSNACIMLLWTVYRMYGLSFLIRNATILRIYATENLRLISTIPIHRKGSKCQLPAKQPFFVW